MKAQEARENLQKGRLSVIEAGKFILEKKKEAQERHKEVQIIQDEMKSGNKAEALRKAKEDLMAATQRMKDAKEREKAALMSVKERERIALQKVNEDRAQKQAAAALIRQKEQEKKELLRKQALEE